MNPFVALILLFICVPLFEIYLFIEIGSVIGALPTIALILVTAVVGVWLLRIQGLATYRRYQNVLMQGEIPAMEVLEGMALLVGGALLLTPGFFTDAVGLLCLIPATRRMMLAPLLRRLRVTVTGASTKRTAGGRVIEGEYRRKY